MTRAKKPRPSTSARRTCPACSRRWNQQVADDCPVCAGDGYLTLGRPALMRWPADVVSLAVEYTLENQARKDLAAPHPDMATARAHMTAMVTRMRTAGLLATTASTEPTPIAPGTGRMTVAEVHTQARRLTPGYSVGTAAALRAPVLEFDADDRPMAHGGLPGFSAGAHVSHLAQVADPLDPLTMSTRQLEARRRIGDRTSRVIAHTQPMF